MNYANNKITTVQTEQNNRLTFNTRFDVSYKSNGS